MKKIKSKLDAIQTLRECDHVILTVEGAKEFANWFGLPESEIPIQRIQDRRSEFKGAYFPDLKEGDWTEGVDASLLASHIALHLKVNFQEMFGRGSQLRSACGAIENYLKS